MTKKRSYTEAEIRAAMHPAWKSVLVNPREANADIDVAFLLERAIQPCVQSGIYFLLHKGKVVYVGQSKNVLSRLGRHATNIKFDLYSYIQYPPHLLNQYERRYIEKFQPKYNRMGVL